jgi:hypothetical protein
MPESQLTILTHRPHPQICNYQGAKIEQISSSELGVLLSATGFYFQVSAMLMDWFFSSGVKLSCRVESQNYYYYYY